MARIQQAVLQEPLAFDCRALNGLLPRRVSRHGAASLSLVAGH
jgi:hypothetical protein